MILVRDKTLKPTEYKGRPTLAVYKDCPCRPCYNAHDCGRLNSQGKWVPLMHCVTNWNRGCPDPDIEPEHIYVPRGRVCKRCGIKKPTQAQEVKSE
jgi:hypothetical protein